MSPSPRLNSLPKWVSAAMAITAVGAWIWASNSGPPDEREEVQARCSGPHLLVKVKATGSFDGDDWSRRATYICFPGPASQPEQYRVMSRNGHVVEVRSNKVWWPYIFLAIAVVSGAWRANSSRRRRGGVDPRS